MSISIESELDGFDSDINDLKRKINEYTTSAMQEVAKDMRVCLANHVADDVYMAYQPKSYPRRLYNPQFGKSIGEQSLEATISTKESGAQAYIIYQPDGSHSGKMSDRIDSARYGARYAVGTESGDAPLKPHPVHGDDLIERLETGKGYDWNVSPPPRPFFTNFVEEEIEGGRAEHTFASSFNAIDTDYQIESTGLSVIRGEDDWSGFD